MPVAAALNGRTQLDGSVAAVRLRMKDLAGNEHVERLGIGE